MVKKIFITLVTAGLSLSALQAQSILSLKESITDNAIVLPESFETDTHKMMQNWYLQNYTVLDRNVEFRPDASVTDQELIERLAKIPAEIEMPFNSVVKSYINTYTQRRRTLVENMLGMSLYYMPIFEQALEREGLPLELRYLPVIESALNPDAVSRVGATGLWQFMLPTARGLGLEISSVVDERRDPVRSSEMAAKYLKELHAIYNDWSLAIAAYNCGPGNVNKALRRAGEGKKDFWDIYAFLPAETRGYVPAFIAANYVMTYYGEHNISPALARRPIITDSVHVKRRVYFQQISDVLDIPVEEIRILNPQYRKDYIPGDLKPYPLVLPSQQVYCYIMSEDSIVAHNAEKYSRRYVVEPADGSVNTREDGDYIITERTKYHKVKSGETFTSIARKYGVTVASIKSVNKIKKLRRGTTIKIVTTERTPKPKEIAETPEPVVFADSMATVLPSDSGRVTVDSLSVDGVLVVDPDLRQVNAADTAGVAAEKQTPEVKSDNKSKSPVKEEKKKVTPPAPEKQYHTVKKGESLYKIAKRYGTTVNKLLKLNNLTEKSKIQPGQKIRIK